MSQAQTGTQRELELSDIQGNIVRAYGRFHYPFARYFFLNIPRTPKPTDGRQLTQQEAARKFVNQARLKVTTASRWPEVNGQRIGPQVTLNIGFSFYGLMALGLPVKTLSGLPPEFIEGMKSRSSVLGDRDPIKMAVEDPHWNKHWDEIWRNNRAPDGDPDKNVHIWISMNAKAQVFQDKPAVELEEQTQWLRDCCDEFGVSLLSGIGQDGQADFQQASAIFRDVLVEPEDEKTQAVLRGMGLDLNSEHTKTLFQAMGIDTAAKAFKLKVPTPCEHFGFTDGIGDPVFKGQYPEKDMDKKVIGRGKLMRSEGRAQENNLAKDWEPLETGEFILGYPDESQELPPTPQPDYLFHNGSFMVFRKLHENVGSFKAVVEREAKKYQKVNGVDFEEAHETLLGKMVGRWRNGVPLAVAPTYRKMQGVSQEYKLDKTDTLPEYLEAMKYLGTSDISNFRYADDMAGQRCPIASHLRRTNTRDMLDPKNKPNDQDEQNRDSTSALNKRRRILRRGLPYGPSSGGCRDEDEQGVIFMTIGSSIFRQFEFVQQQWIQYGLDFNAGNSTCPLLGRHDNHDSYIVPGNPDMEGGAKRTFVMTGLKNFVECRGGDYFFIPSLTALAAFAMGNVDPT